MQPGCWYRISGDTPDLDLPPTARGTRYLVDNDPARDATLNPPRSAKERLRRMLGREWMAPWRGRVGFSAITEAWNSAVYASGYGRCGSMVVFGGGHANYYGADMHAFDLDRRTWRRISNGWVDGAPADYGEGAIYPSACYPNGSPLPPHTYDYVQYDPLGNDLLLAKGQTELGRNVTAAPIPHCFDFTAQKWRSGPRHCTAILNSGGFSTWDASRRVLWVHCGDDGGGNAFIPYSPDGENPDGSFGHWGEWFPNKMPGFANHNAMQIVPGLDRIIVASHSRDALGAIDPRDPGAPIEWLLSSGERPALAEFAALQFAPSGGHLTYTAPRDRGAVFAIDIDGEGCHWRRIDETVLDPFADAARHSHYPVNRDHLFGRLRIATYADVELAILVRHVDSPVYALRLL